MAWLNLTGLPKAAPISGKSQTGTAQLNISGALDAPSINGTGDLYGAKFVLNTNLSPLKASLQLLEAGSGRLLLENNRLSGKILYQDSSSCENKVENRERERERIEIE